MNTMPFTIHSPVEPLALHEFSEAGIQVDVKRDDLIHPYISGNKWRKLKHLLIDAHSTGKNHLVTFGGAWSNHLLATACAGAKFGFQTTAFVRGEAVSNPVLSLCLIFGMNLLFVDRTQYQDKMALYNQFATTHVDTYFIDEGGRSPLAAQGCAEIIEELDISYDHIFCACGTGTTVAGLAQGVAQHKKNTLVHGIPVLKGGDFLQKDINRIVPPLAPKSVQLHTDYHFGGYAKHTDELRRFVTRFSSETGILIEPVYTGKLFYALMDMARRNVFTKGDRILALHTGGLTGLLGIHQQIADSRISPRP